MSWESRSNKNLFGWEKGQRKASLAIICSWPELKLGNLAPGIMVLNGGARGPWYVVAERGR
jgi:hypothetical protein